jgi:hypothetical protein
MPTSVEFRATKTFSHGQVHEYEAALPDGNTAILTLLPGRGWYLVIRQPHGAGGPGCLFATPFDAEAALNAQFFPPEG